MKLGKEVWQYGGSLAFVVIALVAWSTLLWNPAERSSRTLSSQSTAYDFYLSGNYRAAWDTLMALELERRPLNEASAGALERLILDLYTEPLLSLSAGEAAEGFGKLLSRKDVPSGRRHAWEVYEKSLLDIDSQKYSVEGFIDKVASLQEQRLQIATGTKKADRKQLERLNEGFRIYFAHAQKKWNETRQSDKINLRWLFAAGYSGSLYYAQGQRQLEEYLALCSTSQEACLTEDQIKAREILRLLRGVESPIGDESP